MLTPQVNPSESSSVHSSDSALSEWTKGFDDSIVDGSYHNVENSLDDYDCNFDTVDDGIDSINNLSVDKRTARSGLIERSICSKQQQLVPQTDSSSILSLGSVVIVARLRDDVLVQNHEAVVVGRYYDEDSIVTASNFEDVSVDLNDADCTEETNNANDDCDMKTSTIVNTDEISLSLCSSFQWKIPFLTLVFFVLYSVILWYPFWYPVWVHPNKNVLLRHLSKHDNEGLNWSIENLASTEKYSDDVIQGFEDTPRGHTPNRLSTLSWISYHLKLASTLHDLQDVARSAVKTQKQQLPRKNNFVTTKDNVSELSQALKFDQIRLTGRWKDDQHTVLNAIRELQLAYQNINNIKIYPASNDDLNTNDIGGYEQDSVNVLNKTRESIPVLRNDKIVGETVETNHNCTIPTEQTDNEALHYDDNKNEVNSNTYDAENCRKKRNMFTQDTATDLQKLFCAMTAQIQALHERIESRTNDKRISGHLPQETFQNLQEIRDSINLDKPLTNIVSKIIDPNVGNAMDNQNVRDSNTVSMEEDALYLSKNVTDAFVEMDGRGNTELEGGINLTPSDDMKTEITQEYKLMTATKTFKKMRHENKDRRRMRHNRNQERLNGKRNECIETSSEQKDTKCRKQMKDRNFERKKMRMHMKRIDSPRRKGDEYDEKNDDFIGEGQAKLRKPDTSDLNYITKLFVVDLWDDNPADVFYAIREIVFMLKDSNEFKIRTIKSIHNEVGGFATIVGALRKWYNNEAIQAYGIDFLRITLDSSWSLFHKIAQSTDIVKVVLAAMKNYPKNDTIQGAGCGVLHLLSKTSGDLGRPVMAVEIIDATISAMILHPTELNVRRYASQILYRLSRWDELNNRIRKAGGVIALKKVSKMSQHDTETQKWINYALIRLE